MYFKIKSIMDSATFTPEESASDIKSLAKKFFSMMGDSDDKEENKKDNEGGVSEEEIWESKESITGQIIFSD